MNCDFAEVSVLEDKGIEELFELVVDKCMNLHQHIQSLAPSDEKEQANKDKDGAQAGFKLLN